MAGWFGAGSGLASSEPMQLDWGDDRYRSAVADLLGVLAYAEFRAFENLAADAAMAPRMTDRAAIAEMAVAEHGHFQKLCAELLVHDIDPEQAMAPFAGAVDAFHRATAPSDWLEGLVKAYVGDGIATDFYREIAAFVDQETRRLVVEVCSDLGHSAFVVDRVRRAISEDPAVGGRLALWGRRLVGEAFAQAQAVAVEREGLATLLFGGADSDMGTLEDLFTRVTDAHVARLESLGLSA